MRATAGYLQHAILEELAQAWEKIAALRERDLIDAKTAFAPDQPKDRGR
jgi:hypothetical protein